MSLRICLCKVSLKTDFLVILDFLKAVHLGRLVHLTLLGNAQINKLSENKILEQFVSSFLSPNEGLLHAICYPLV